MSATNLYCTTGISNKHTHDWKRSVLYIASTVDVEYLPYKAMLTAKVVPADHVILYTDGIGTVTNASWLRVVEFSSPVIDMSVQYCNRSIHVYAFSLKLRIHATYLESGRPKNDDK